MSAGDGLVARIRADRAKRGLPPTIQSPKVYLLLSAVIDAQREKADARATADDDPEPADQAAAGESAA